MTHVFPFKEHQLIEHDTNQTIFNRRRNHIRNSQVSLIRNLAGVTINMVPRKEYRAQRMCNVCNNKLYFLAPPPKVHRNACTLSELAVFHKVRNVDKPKP